ncbi:MAG: hypothetical protein GX270_06975 [Clostridiaceae bacterium]|nr:hypothetical protein [Clostridiaceae bacterium]
MFEILASLTRKIKILFFLLFGLIFFSLTVVNIKRIDRSLYKYAAIYLVIVLFFSYLIYKIKRRWTFLAGLVVLSITVRLIWIFTVNTQPVSDFSIQNYAANLILEGQYSVVKGIDYFNVWVYQLGFSVFCSFLYSIFGSNILVVKVFNVIFSSGIAVLIYLMAAKIFNEKAGRIASFLYAIYIQSIIFNSLLTNQIVSAFFIYLGILLIVYKSGWFYYLISGISIAIGHIMRPEGSFALYIIAGVIVLYHVLNVSKKKGMFSKSSSLSSSDLIWVLSKIGVFILAFNLVIQLFSYSLKSMDITDYSFGNRNVYWKFVLGLNPSTNGGYSNEDVKILNEYPVGEELYRAEKDVIRERLSDRSELIKLMIRKFNIMWTHEDSTIGFISPGTKLTTKQMNYILELEKIQYAALLFCVCLTTFMAIKSKKEDMNLLILMMLISANFAVYLFVEIQTRYRYFIMPAFFVLSGYCMSTIIKSFKGFFGIGNSNDLLD